MSYVFIAVVLVWFGFELGLLLFKRSSGQARNADRSSLRYIWLVILVGNSSGIFFGLQGIGRIHWQGEIFNFVGMGLIIAGLLLRGLAVYQLKQYFTVDVALHADHQLVRRGLYRYLRHPSYTGSLMSFFGLGIAFANWLSVLCISLPILTVFLYRIRLEEAELQQHFGQDYLDYMDQSRRLLPGIW